MAALTISLQKRGRAVSNCISRVIFYSCSIGVMCMALARAAESAPDADQASLSEIVVTAQKRSERLQDVPVPVSTVSADALISANQLRLQDYYASIPGLSVTPNDQGAPNLTIRGLTTGGYTNPTVGVVIDDVPYGSSSALVLGEAVPDLDPSDLNRVEVLRGPQGTLYGASSLGGLLKYVTVDPSTDALRGTVQATTSSVRNGDQVGYGFRGSVNIPLSESLAIRASAFTRQDPGYIDDPGRHDEGVNEGHSTGGRLSALWRPSQDLSLKVSALYQQAKADGSSQVDVQPGLGDLHQNDARGTGGFDRKIQAYSATLNAKFAGLDFTSLTGYSVNRIYESYDYTAALALLTSAFFPPNIGSPFVTNSRTNKFTQEFRLSGAVGTNIEWLLGAFYNHEDSPYTIDYLATNYDTGAVAGNGLHFTGPLKFTEIAGFFDLTYHFTDRFNVQVGGREAEDKQSYSEVYSGIYTPIFFPGNASPLVYPTLDTKDNSFTYLVTPQFKLSSNLMLYARFASGFRPGGPNVSLSASAIPPTYGPDKTQNYELGIKGDALDHVLSYDASVYYIDWKDIQVQLRDPVSGGVYFVNGSRAKSQGIEFSADAHPIEGLKLAAWIAWNDAKLKEPLPPGGPGTAVGDAGDRLPYSSRFSGSLSIDQEISVTAALRAFASASVSYVGSREGIFVPSPQRQTFPGYTKTDLRAGVRYETWSANLFVNNLADRRGVLSGGIGALVPTTFNLIAPRTIGVSLTKNFE